MGGPASAVGRYPTDNTGRSCVPTTRSIPVRAELAEVRRITTRYPAGTIRRILLYDLVGRSTFNHVALGEVERRGGEFGRR